MATVPTAINASTPTGQAASGLSASAEHHKHYVKRCEEMNNVITGKVEEVLK